MKNVLYLGWLGYKNIGDELMWEIFKQKFDEKVDKSKYRLFPSDKNRLSMIKRKKMVLRHYNTIVLGGGSLLTPSYINILYNAIQIKKDIEIIIWGSGIDWIERRDLNKLLFGNEMIKQKKDNEFNVFRHKDFKLKLQIVLNHAKFAAVRGNYTFEVLKNMGLNLDNVLISDDPGLLVKTPNNQGTIKEKGLVALNWGTAKNKLFGKNENKIENELVLVVKDLIDKGYHLCIFPVFEKDIVPCQRLYNKIADEKRVELKTTLYNQNELLNLIQKCSFTINLKLHANVLAAVAGIPFIALGYRFKTFDFANSIGLDDLVVPTDDSNIHLSILNLANYIEGHQDIMQHIPPLQLECEKKLDQIFTLFT
jgi:exopolysaccharide biosynthesis predicted pyruvyltransferase EpsI